MDYIDYSEVRLQFIGIRKHFFKDKQYHAYVFDNCMVMGEMPKMMQPKYFIVFDLNTKIKWNLRKTKLNSSIESFSFPYKKGFKQINADPLILLKLKDLMSLKVTFEEIHDFYSQLNQIGKGSSAKVYSASSILEKQVYAIKAIEKSFLKSQNEQGQAAFKMEVQILKTICKYPQHFITLKEIFEGEDIHYLVTTYLEGPCLSEEFDRLKITNSKRLPIQCVKMIIKKLLINLSVLHQYRIIHRDLKPDNLMFQKKNDYSSLVLVDFGLATSETMEKYLMIQARFLFPKCGTPGYVAPEILTLGPNNRYTTKVDIFSSGCILYKLLTGKNLFGGQTFEEALKQNRKCQIEFNMPMDSQYLTESSINLLSLMLLKNPKNRITAKAALSHPFFDQMNDNSTLFQFSLLSPKPSTNGNYNIKFEQQSFDSFDNEQINNEKQIEEVNYIQLPKSKRCSLMGEFSSPSNLLDVLQFYQKEPLSGIKCIKVSQSPFVSQVLE